MFGDSAEFRHIRLLANKNETTVLGRKLGDALPPWTIRDQCNFVVQNGALQRAIDAGENVDAPYGHDVYDRKV